MGGEERKCDTLKLACLSTMREEPRASIDEGQEQVVASKTGGTASARDGGRREVQVERVVGWECRVCGSRQQTVRRNEGGLLLGEGSNQNREDAGRGLKMIDRTGGCKEAVTRERRGQLQREIGGGVEKRGRTSRKIDQTELTHSLTHRGSIQGAGGKGQDPQTRMLDFSGDPAPAERNSSPTHSLPWALANLEEGGRAVANLP